MFSLKKSRLTLAAASIAVMAIAGATFAGPTAADAAPTQAATGNVSQANTLTKEVQRTVKGSGAAAETAAVSSYWTSARMKAATSLDTVATKQSVAIKTAPQGPAGQVSGQAPKVTPKVVQKPAVGTGYDYPNFPYYHPTARTVGKVFFSRTYGGYTYNFVCSGAIVNTEGKSTVWTAGHCVYGPYNGGSGAKVWDSNFTFVPSYSNGSAPYGYWYARNLTTTGGWYYNGDLTQDNGAAWINRNYGYRIADYLGAQGITWNNTVNWYANAFGYPQGAPFTGAYLVRAQGYTYQSGSTLYMYSGLTGGSSGGPWLRSYDGNYGYINGHNDFIYTNNPNYMYTPYYGNQVASLYNAVRYQSS